MEKVDFSAIIVGYNFVIGVLLMLSSEKFGTYAGHVNKMYKAKLVRFTHISVLTLGSTWAALSAFIYIVWHWFRIGL
jgi:hypothetical protein